MTTAQKLLATAAVIFPAAMAIAPSVAHATPYAFASNQITGLTITKPDGSSLSGVIATATTADDSASFGTAAGAVFHGTGVVGDALTIPQAYSGPGPTPSAVFTAVGPGNFIGTRALASISAGSASTGGVGVSNVAEGTGSQTGTSQGNNTATITLRVTGTGEAVLLSFTDAFALTASTAAATNPDETATASISNQVSVTPTSGSSPIFTDNPDQVNKHIASQIGVPPNNTIVGNPSLSILTPILAAGQDYDISLSSVSVESIIPGTTITPVPEPASIAVLGVGLLGLGLTFRRKRG